LGGTNSPASAPQRIAFDTGEEAPLGVETSTIKGYPHAQILSRWLENDTWWLNLFKENVFFLTKN